MSLLLAVMLGALLGGAIGSLMTLFLSGLAMQDREKKLQASFEARLEATRRALVGRSTPFPAEKRH